MKNNGNKCIKLDQPQEDYREVPNNLWALEAYLKDKVKLIQLILNIT